MHQLLIATLVFAASGIYVFILSEIANSPSALQKAIVFPVTVFFLFLYFASTSSWKKILTSNSKWILLFLCTMLVLLIILSTGGLKSPFLILIHLFMVGISFVFSFQVPLLFLITSFLVLLVNLSINNVLLTLLQTEPTFLLLQLSSLVAIVPVAYIVSQHYHFKDTMFKKLNKQVAADESIIESLSELIIITDLDFKILSANDAVVKVMHKSKSEILGTPLFDNLFLKDKEGKLITKDSFFLNKKRSDELIDDFIIMKTSLPQQKVSVHTKPIKDPDGIVSQISFIISNNQPTKQSSEINLDKTKALYEAMIKNIKKELSTKKFSEIYTKIVMLEKFQNDIYQAQTINNSSFNKNIARIDIAQLCKRTVLNLDFAKAFHVPTDFAIHNFTMKDIQPLITDNFQLKPEEFTGPFFTAECDPKHLEILIEKLLDLAILLAATQQKSQVIISVERGSNHDFIVDITGRSPHIVHEEIEDIFLPYYRKLAKTTNLHAGSGLEGYLAKTISDNLKLPLKVTQNNSLSTISFTLRIPKKSSHA